MEAREELKPCPFCGGKAFGEYINEYDYGIVCRDCGAMSKPVNYHHGNIEEISIKAWQQRKEAK